MQRKLYKALYWRLDGSVGIATMLRAERLRDCNSIPGGGKIFNIAFH
jgi:hypothetical protein